MAPDEGLLALLQILTGTLSPDKVFRAVLQALQEGEQVAL